MFSLKPETETPPGRFPTHRPKDTHVGLTLLSFYFGVQEGHRPQTRGINRASRSPILWRRFHWTCTSIIALAIVFFGVSKTTGLLKSHALLITETVAVLAFGVSWSLRGLELDVLLPRTTTRSRNTRAAGQISVSRANRPDNAEPLTYRATDVHYDEQWRSMCP
jgi:hypothetical protein